MKSIRILIKGSMPRNIGNEFIFIPPGDRRDFLTFETFMDAWKIEFIKDTSGGEGFYGGNKYGYHMDSLVKIY